MPSAFMSNGIELKVEALIWSGLAMTCSAVGTAQQWGLFSDHLVLPCLLQCFPNFSQYKSKQRAHLYECASRGGAGWYEGAGMRELV